MAWLTNPESWIALLTLTVLEIVLGIDNVIFISILAGKLPGERQAQARRLGLFLAMFIRIGLLASLAHEYRSNARFADADSVVRTALGFRSVTFKLEIRIQTAVVSYQFRNLLQESYAQVPGFRLPRQTQFYGVRWDFWN